MDLMMFDRNALHREPALRRPARSRPRDRMWSAVAALLAATVIGTTLPTAAEAATLIVTGGVGGYGSGPAQINVSKFNNSLGMLTGVTISYSLGAQFSGSLGNFGPAPLSATVSVSGGYAYLADANANQIASGTFSGTSDPIVVAASPGGGEPGVTNFSYSVPGATGTLAEWTAAPALAAFTGSGNYTFFVGGAPGTGTNDGATYFGGLVNPVDSVSVQYTYDTASLGAVPETATWAMMVAGFGVIGASLRRRSRKAIVA